MRPVLALLLAACARHTTPECEPPTVEYGWISVDVPSLDLLVVIDNSVSMSAEEEALAAELPRLVSILTTGDRDQDGDTYLDGELNDRDFRPDVSLHLGVITTDMGSGGYTMPTCEPAELGDDGVLRTEGSGDLGCTTSYPSILSFHPERGDDPGPYADTAACMARVGTDGCGFEQPLEAALKALSPSAATTWTAPDYVAPFFAGGPGHGDRTNAGFVRDGSVLAILALTDEDDCSVSDDNIFDAAGPYASTPLNLRCALHPEALHPIERYVDGLLQLRARPQTLAFISISGVPADLAGEVPVWDAIACEDAATCDPRMRAEPDPDDPTGPRESCTGPYGRAFPPVRIMRVARELEERGADVGVHSICQGGFEGALDDIIGTVVTTYQADCFGRVLALEEDGSVDCEMHIVLHDANCTDFAGSQPLLEDGAIVLEEGEPVCVVPQIVPSDRSPGAPPPSETGWYYDDFTPLALSSCGGTRIAFTQYPSSSAELRFVCAGATARSIGTPCEDAASCATALPPRGSTPLTCDPIASACAVSCTSDDDCAAAGVDGYVCDVRPLGELDARFAGNTDPRHVCVDPTCG